MGIGGPGGDGGRDRGRVLIVASSPINRIVISHTIERIYLKPTAVAPEAALSALDKSRPMMVIIDGMGEDEMPSLLAEIARQRRASQMRLPRVVLIAEPTGRTPPHDETIDAVVSKPITPDVLQPVVERVAQE